MEKLVQGTHRASKVHLYESESTRKFNTFYAVCGSWINSWQTGLPKVWESEKPNEEVTCKHCLKELNRRSK